jgi:type II secretion system protein H
MEMLVVTAIIGLLTGMAVLSLRVLGVSDRAEAEAKRLMTALVVAREFAELEQRHIGLQIDTQGYAFAAFSPRRNEWIPLEERALPAGNWDPEVEVSLFIEGRAAVLDQIKEKRPALGIDPAGDYTLFELEIRERGQPRVWQLTPGADGRLQLTSPTP